MSYLNDLMTRLVEMEKEAIANSDAVGYFFHSQNAFPYWTNRLGDTDYDYDSEDFQQRTYSIVIRYIIGHLTEGEEGAPETRLLTDIPAIEDFFAERPGLQSTAHPVALTGLDPLETEFGRSTGLRVFQNVGIQASQVGVEFTLTVRFDTTIDRQYWR